MPNKFSTLFFYVTARCHAVHDVIEDLLQSTWRLFVSVNTNDIDRSQQNYVWCNLKTSTSVQGRTVCERTWRHAYVLPGGPVRHVLIEEEGGEDVKKACSNRNGSHHKQLERQHSVSSKHNQHRLPQSICWRENSILGHWRQKKGNRKWHHSETQA